MIFKKAILWSLIFLTASFGCADTDNEVRNSADSESSNYVVDDKKSVQKAPDFILPSIDGKQVKLSDYKGKIVILDFWATWCGPCRIGIPDLVEIQNEYKDKVVIIGISLDTTTKNEVVPFAKEFKINYPVVYGTGEVVQSYGGIRGIPTTFVIDEEGNIVAHHLGLMAKKVYTDEIKRLTKS
jgi:thiol-disulfide isomerase/thioredoxin